MLSLGERHVLSRSMGLTQAEAPLPLRQEILGWPILSTEAVHAFMLG